MGTSVPTGTAENLGAPAPRVPTAPYVAPYVAAPQPPTRPAAAPPAAAPPAAAPPAGAARGAPAPGAAGAAAWLTANFRLHGERDPAPPPARMVGLCAWAAALGLIGLPIAGRSSVAIMMGTAPAWFEPVVVTIGLAGIALTSAGFASVHRERLPWRLLAAATAALLANLTVVLVAL